MSEMSEEELKVLLNKNGFKATPQRLAICIYILQSKEHPTAEKILSDVKKEHSMVSQATVYKTISLLKKLGLISELSLDYSHSRFDPNQQVHINIICPNCNLISDYESSFVNEFWDNITSEIGGTITGQRFDLYKICKNCQVESDKLA